MRSHTPYDRALKGGTVSLLKLASISTELINVRREAKDLVSEADMLVHKKGWDCVIDKSGNDLYLLAGSNGRLFSVTKVSEDHYDFIVRGPKVSLAYDRFRCSTASLLATDEISLSNVILPQAGKQKSYQGSLIARSFYQCLEARYCDGSNLLFSTAYKIASAIKNAHLLKQVIADIEIYIKYTDRKSSAAGIISDWLENLQTASSHKILADPLFQKLNIYHQYLKGKIALETEQLREIKDNLCGLGVDLPSIERRNDQLIKLKVSEFLNSYLKIQNYLDSDGSRSCKPVPENDIKELKLTILNLVDKDSLKNGCAELKPYIQQSAIQADFPFLSDKLEAAVRLCKDHSDEVRDFSEKMRSVAAIALVPKQEH